MPPLLSHEEAARWLGISPGELKALVDARQLPYVKLGRGTKRPRRKYREADLEALAAKRLTWAAPAAPPGRPPKQRPDASIVEIAEALRSRTGVPPGFGARRK